MGRGKASSDLRLLACVLDVTASAQILIKQAVVLVNFGALGRIELAATARTLDERRHAFAVEPVQFASYRLARLARRQRARTRIASAGASAST